MRCMKCMEDIGDSGICSYCGHQQDALPENQQYLYPGTVLNDQYLIGTVIGAGGFGITYVGWDQRLNRKIAVKEYFPSSVSTRIPGQTIITAFSGEKQEIFNHGRERFWEEAQLLMKFSGERGIVSVYDVVEANGTVYMIMEFVEGITLKQNIEQFGPLSEEHLLDCIIPLLLSLKYVHSIGVIHRDISPDNIMCLPDGSIKLLDFGAARYSVMEESKSLSVIVKHGYTPIEQYQSHGKQGPFTDIYAIGATMYKALTGITPDDSLERLSNDTVKKPSQCGVKVSSQMENAILTAMNVRTENRPQTIDDFISILVGETTGAVVVQKKSNKVLALAAVLASTVVLGCGILGWAFLSGRLAPPPIVYEQVDVPNAISKPEPVAEKLFADHELGMIVKGGVLYDAKLIEQGFIEENLVVSQNPSSGKVDKGTNIGVEVSKGKEKEHIPSVTDMMKETAQHQFEQSGFTDSFDIQFEEEYSDTNMAGTVISQNIPEDTAVDFDGTITLTISLGKKNPSSEQKSIQLESYIGKDFGDVKKKLLEDEIYLVKSASVYSKEYPYGSIVSQMPEAGESVTSGGAVYVITSLGEEMSYVPDVRYMPLSDAKNKLMENGLTWKIKYVVDPMVEKGLVAQQLIEPGLKIPFGSTIDLYVSADAEGNEAVQPISFQLTASVSSLEIGEQTTISCSYTGESSIVWSSSNTNIAEVDQNGTVTGKRFGSVTISAAVDGNVATITIMINDDSVITSIQDYTLEVGDTVSLATSIPSDILSETAWRSSYPSVASVDQNGTVTAVEAGYTAITVTYKNQTVSCGIIVNEKIEYIKISKPLLLGKFTIAEQALISNNIEYDVVEEYSDTYVQGNLIRFDYVGYSDNDSFYITKGSKVVLYHSLGKNTIQSISVKKMPNKTSYYVGEKPDYSGLILSAHYRNGAAQDITGGYTADALPFAAVGKQKLSIYYQNFTAQIEVTVNAVEATSLSISPSSVTCKLSETKTLTATVSPDNTTDKAVTWSSADSSIVSVDQSGKITAKKAGTTEIKASTSNGKSAVCKVTVTADASLKLKEKPSKTVYYLGDEFDESGMVLSYDDGSGKPVDVKSGYTVECDIFSEGPATAIVRYKGLYVYVDITVKTPSIKVTKLNIQDQLILSVVTDPEDAEFSWSSSDEEVFYFGYDNMIVANGYGTAYAIATMIYNDIEYSDRVPITVTEQKNYEFSLYYEPIDGISCVFLNTDLPITDYYGVRWSVSPTVKWEYYEHGIMLYGYQTNYTVTASYTYNGKVYSDTITIEAMTYQFELEAYVEYLGPNKDAQVTCVPITNLPVTASDLKWSVSPSVHWDIVSNGIVVYPGGMDQVTVTATYNSLTAQVIIYKEDYYNNNYNQLTT